MRGRLRLLALLCVAGVASASCQDASPATSPGDPELPRQELADGESCDSWADCASSVCLDGLCGAAAATNDDCGRAGASCNARRDCCAGIACVDNLCSLAGPSPEAPQEEHLAPVEATPACREQGPCLALYDEGADGIIERQTVYRYEDCLLVSEQGARADGQPGRRTTRGYDVRGHLAWVEYDLDDDGAVDVAERWESDPDGRPLTGQIDMGADGLDDQSDLMVRYTYNFDGTKRSQERDLGADGVVDARYAYVHLDEGRTVVEDYVWLTRVDAGEIYYRNIYLQRDGRLASLSHDMHANGIVQWRRAYTYDDDGRLVEEAQDTGDDGVVEFRTTYSYGCWDDSAE